MKTLIIIPTYNETENIAELTKAIFTLSLNVDILVVDDNSPDGTADQVLELQLNYPNLHLLKRDQKDGLGRAYLAGFAWAREHGYEAVVQMDADFSHSPKYLEVILQALETNDFVIGSRYVKGGGVVNWPLMRQIISRGGGLYARTILGLKIKDLTGGFNAWRLTTLDKIKLNTINSNGYSFQIELKTKAVQVGCTYQEAPIIFEERRLGQSKLKGQIVFEAIGRVWQIKWQLLDKKTFTILGLILLSTFFVYSNLLTNSKILEWDDQYHVLINPDVQTLTFHNLQKIFSSAYMGMYQPIASTIFMMGNHFWRGQAPIFHLLNIILHLINIVLVFKLVQKITNKKNWSLIVTAIFALHPVQVESVAWISAITVPLSTLFILWASIKYLSYLDNTKNNRRLVVVGVLFILAILSKSASIIILPLMLLFDWWKKRPFDKKLWLEKIPFIFLALISGINTVQNRFAVGHNKTIGYDFSWWEKLMAGTYAIWLYLKTIILPSNLSPYYPFPEKINGHLAWFYWLPLISLILLLPIIIIKRHHISRLTYFASAWFIVNLILVLNFIKFSPQAIAERYLYLAIIGLSLILIKLVYQFTEVYPKMKTLVAISFGLYLLFLTILSWRQTAIWKNDESLLDAFVFANSNLSYPYLARAEYLIKRDSSSTKALNDVDTALLISPNFIRAHEIRSEILFNQKDFKLFLVENDWLIKNFPFDANNYFNQGIAWLELENTNQACSIWKQGMDVGLSLELKFKKLCPKL
jgi:dolichol-phosphate mannosyltransferase